MHSFQNWLCLRTFNCKYPSVLLFYITLKYLTDFKTIVEHKLNKEAEKNVYKIICCEHTVLCLFEGGQIQCGYVKCQNNVGCEPIAGGWACKCKPGYSGGFCENSKYLGKYFFPTFPPPLNSYVGYKINYIDVRFVIGTYGRLPI